MTTSHIHTAVHLDGRKVAEAIRAMASTSQREVTFEELPNTDGLLSTVFNVEMCAVGMEYPLASGPKTFTPEDLLQAVASQDDPAIQAPRVWLGHPDDQRFHAGRTSPVGSAEPALGKVVNMRVEDEGMTLVGDIVGTPTWLAKILASAFPSRSIEGMAEAETVTGHKWGLVITDLALLGVVWPGVSTLEDLQALYSENGPDGIEVKEEDMTIAASRDITAQVNVDDVRRAFYEVLGEMDISNWSWIRAMQLDPNELIVDDDEGGLFRVNFTISGESVTFDDPAAVKIKYVNASQEKDPDARGLLVNMLTRDQKIVAAWDQRAESRPDTTTQEGSSVNPEIIRSLRARLGLTEEQLPDDATEEQVLQAMRDDVADPNDPQNQPNAPTGNPSAPAGGNPVTTPATGPAETPTGDDPQAPPPSPDQVAAARAMIEAAGLVAVPAEGWAQVQSNAAAGARVAQQTEAQRRDTVVANAVKEGRISPAQRASFAAMFDKDPGGTEILLTAAVDKGGLMPGTIPVTAMGIDPSPADLHAEAYPSHWLPEIQAQAESTPITIEG
jgi:hypothetical protein